MHAYLPALNRKTDPCLVFMSAVKHDLDSRSSFVNVHIYCIYILYI